MKRLNQKVEKEIEKLGLKKFDGLDAICTALESIEAEEEIEFAENGVLHYEGVNNSGEFLKPGFPDYFGGLRLGDWKRVRKWDLEAKHELIYGNEKESKGLSLDLNVPMSPGEKRAEIINIESDDSDDELEILGNKILAKGKGKEIDIGTPDYGLEIVKPGNVAHESSSTSGSERKYTRDEKGKIVFDPWLSIQEDYPMDLDFWPENLLTELKEDVQVRLADTWQPDPSPVMPQLAEQAVRQPQPVIIRHTNDPQLRYLRKIAKRFARAEHPNESSGTKSTTEKQKPVNVKAIDQLRKCSGLFSEAIRGIRERTSKRAAEELIEWKPVIENRDYCVGAFSVPSLLELSLKSLAENADSLVSLEQVPYFLRKKLIDLLGDKRKMNAEIFNLLLEGCPAEIRVKNCSWLTDEQFHQSIGSFQTENLRVLQLDLCGQSMFDFAFRNIFTRSSNSFSNLVIISLRGACRLTDIGLKLLVTSARSLLSINLGHCSLLTFEAINSITDSLGSNLRELYIDGCEKINAMLIVPAIKKFKNLEVFSVAGIRDVSDKFICHLVIACGKSIKELDLADCLDLTDVSLNAIGSYGAGLRSLNISNLDKVTDLGIEYLANGFRSIQRLKLSRSRFSDEAIAAFLETSGESLIELTLNNVAEVGPNTALSLAKCSRKLLYLDISWCRRISNKALGLIVDSCLSLKLLKVFGCRQITAVFLNGHSNPQVRVVGLNLDPFLEHVNLLEPEEVFLRYSPLPICTESQFQESSKTRDES